MLKWGGLEMGQQTLHWVCLCGSACTGWPLDSLGWVKQTMLSSLQSPADLNRELT